MQQCFNDIDYLRHMQDHAQRHRSMGDWLETMTDEELMTLDIKELTNHGTLYGLTRLETFKEYAQHCEERFGSTRQIPTAVA